MSKFNVKIFTLFPNMFMNVLGESLLGKGLEKGIWSLEIINIRDYAIDKHNTVDDTPYGGGHGMVMKPDIIANAIDKNCDIKNTKFYYMSPRGEVFHQKKVKKILSHKNIAILCGRYEGVDQRVLDEYNMEEISIGDYVLTGGEIPAMVILDACIRCIPNIVGDEKSLIEDSFGGVGKSDYDELLEYPLYTKPVEWRGRNVPEVLISGHHKKIEDWKLEEARRITEERRADTTLQHKK
jgi:tRNA (guanine37-N1)-methyltransferase